MTLFEEITRDESTLAANMVNHAHNSIKAWAKARGLMAEFDLMDFVCDCTKMERALNSCPEICGKVQVQTHDRRLT